MIVYDCGTHTYYFTFFYFLDLDLEKSIEYFYYNRVWPPHFSLSNLLLLSSTNLQMQIKSGAIIYLQQVLSLLSEKKKR